METDIKEVFSKAFNNLTQEQEYSKEFFNEMHVERSYSDPIIELTEQFMKYEEEKSVLCTGQIGCGKTTELQYMKYLMDLREQNQIIAILVSPFRKQIYTDDFQYTDIIVEIFASLIEHLPEDLVLPKKIITTLRKLIKNLDDEDNINTKLKNSRSLKVGFLNLISLSFTKTKEIRENFRKKTEENLEQILQLIDDILEFIKNQNNMKKVIVIVDDLEKVVNDKVVIRFLEEHWRLIKNRKCSFVITINNRILYNKESHSFKQEIPIWSIPFLAIKNEDMTYDKTVINMIREIILRRVSKKIIHEGGLELAIKYSGGSLSTLFKIYSTAINKVSLTNDDKIKPEFVREAFDSVRLENTIISPSKKKKIQIIDIQNKKYDEELEEDELEELLYYNVLLTYRPKGQRGNRYVLNPTFYRSDQLEKMEREYF